MANRREDHLEKRRKLWILSKTEPYLLLHERSLLITKKWMSSLSKEQWNELEKIEDDPRMRYDDIIKIRSLVEAKVLVNEKSKSEKESGASRIWKALVDC